MNSFNKHFFNKKNAVFFIAEIEEITKEILNKQNFSQSLH